MESVKFLTNFEMVTEAPLKIHNYVIGPFTQVSIPDWKHKTICERESLKGLVLAKTKKKPY